ncbi:MAG: hypothetical protein KatS3mg001_506 [Candidatus Pacearchaeota archaeon]|nr:MAG: hypothetical protein KatS3mg001_506 [Candidatus Pacearchaeota archaeon]
MLNIHSTNQKHSLHHTHHSNNLNHHKRGMDNKKLLWSAFFVLVLVIVVLAYIFLIQERAPKPDPLNVQCAFLCDTGQRNAFCNFRNIINENLIATCEELAKNPAYSKYNVLPCDKFSCELTEREKDQTCVTGLGARWETPTQTGSCPSKEGFFVVKRTPSDNPPLEGQICCFYYK